MISSTNLNSYSTLLHIIDHFVNGCDLCGPRSGVHCAAHAAQFLRARAGAQQSNASSQASGDPEKITLRLFNLWVYLSRFSVIYSNFIWHPIYLFIYICILITYIYIDITIFIHSYIHTYIYIYIYIYLCNYVLYSKNIPKFKTHLRQVPVDADPDPETWTQRTSSGSRVGWNSWKFGKIIYFHRV